MNTLLKKAGIPQMRCKAMTGGKSPASFSYEARLPGQQSFNNYQYVLPRVDVESFWKRVNAMGGGLMNPVDFIQTNLVKKLLEEGFPADVASSGALVGVDHYRRCSQASKKGAMFDDCLHYARLHATYSTPKADRVNSSRTLTHLCLTTAVVI